MGWGDIFADPGIVGTVAKIFGAPEGFSDFATGAAQAYNLFQKTGQKSAATSDYESALNAQKAAGTNLSKTTSQIIAEDAILRRSLLSQTGDLGARLRSVYA